jgi:hypothetical protein
LSEAREFDVVEQYAIFGVASNVGDRLRKQPRIDQMANRADRSRREIDFQVTIIVPRQRRDPVAGSDAVPEQDIRQLPDASIDL